jgi:hypothetical protein
VPDTYTPSHPERQLDANWPRRGHTLNRNVQAPGDRRGEGAREPGDRRPPKKPPSPKGANTPNPSRIPIPFPILIRLMRDNAPRRQSPLRARCDTMGTPFRVKGLCWPPSGTPIFLHSTPGSFAPSALSHLGLFRSDRSAVLFRSDRSAVLWYFALNYTSVACSDRTAPRSSGVLPLTIHPWLVQIGPLRGPLVFCP